MKLTEETISFIQSVLRIAHLVGAEALIIETNRIRGVGPEYSVVILKEGIPELEFSSLGIGRVSTLVSRMNLLKDKEGFTIEANLHKEKDFIRSLMLKVKRTRMEYICSNPAVLPKAPRIINEKLTTGIEYKSEDVAILPKSVDAMGKPTLITIASDEEGVSFQLTDENTKDIYKHIFTENIERHFKFSYPTKLVLTLFKNATEGGFVIGENGILVFPFDDVDVYVPKRIET